MSGKQTDNSQLEEKILLRINSIEKIDKQEIKVLECYSGDGVIWDMVRQRTSKTIKVLRIDVKTDKVGIYLKGDNLKFIASMNLDHFDIIDLDAYGQPFEQLEIVFGKKYAGIVHVTWIMSGTFTARFPVKMMPYLNVTKAMYKKCPTLFSKDAFNNILSYLAFNGVKKIEAVKIDKKHYFWFSMAKAA